MRYFYCKLDREYLCIHNNGYTKWIMHDPIYTNKWLKTNFSSLQKLMIEISEEEYQSILLRIL